MRSVLIVDDKEMLRDSVAVTLQRAGFTVVTAADGPAALELIPRNRRRAYKIRKVIEAVVDRDSLFELTPRFGRSQVTAFARVKGQPVGVLANDCMQSGGSMTADGARKVLAGMTSVAEVLRATEDEAAVAQI